MTACHWHGFDLDADGPLPLAEGAVALLAVDLARSETGALLLAAGQERADRIGLAAAALAPDLPVLVLPGWDSLPGEPVSPSSAVLGRRAAVLAALAAGPRPCLVIATAEAAVQRMAPPAAVAEAALHVRPGMPYDAEAWRDRLARAGYRFDERVDEPGEAALRGATLEIYPGDHAFPLRLDLEEGRVVRLRSYDPVTQRGANGDLDSVVIHPVTELVLTQAVAERLAETVDDLPDICAGARPPGFESLLPLAYDHLPDLFALMPGAPVLMDQAVPERVAARRQQVGELAEWQRDPAFRRTGRIRPVPELADRLLLTAEEWQAALAGRRVASLAEEDGEPASASLPALLRSAAARRAAGDRVVLALPPGRGLDRLQAIAGDLGLDLQPFDAWPAEEALAPGRIGVLALPLAAGFTLPGWSVLALAAPAPRRRAGSPLAPLAQADLAVGDFAVHLDHGVGIVLGLETIAAEERLEDCLALEYAREQRLLVPPADMGRIWRYGSADAGIALDALRGTGWAESKAALARHVGEVAARLVTEATARASLPKRPVEPPAAAMRRFAARFPFDETPGQHAAIAATLADLAEGTPMDRIVCGDVGYGKTEVALRAAAAVALAGFQVAVLAPTTVLARQHFEGFQRRFAGFDVTLGLLTGRQKPAEAAAVRRGIADGTIRVAVGTHALLSRTVRFADLALVVVDEEHKFGVRQKESLARLAKRLHLLTLTATPIPRTLRAAVTGLRALSVIDTAPVRRRPVRTAVLPHDSAVLRQALLREKRRGGQSFCIVPRIADLKAAEAELRSLVPDLTVGVAHGRMRADALDDVMLAFAGGGLDVLLATAIIESGIDIPRANTMLIRRPDLFGLAQLHQLRGRVGRGALQGYAYLLTEPDQPLDPKVARRLGSLEVIESLGGGFALSALDLDLRGGGELFGEQQTGHLRAAGTELYQHLLAEALRTARGEPPEQALPEVRIAASQTIPDDYIPEVELRIGLHRRLAQLRSAAELDALREEVADRFGPPPPAMAQLLDLVGLRARCGELGIAALSAGPAGIAATLRAARPVPGLAAKGDRLVLEAAGATPEAVIANAERTLDLIEEAEG